jgi:hypothetical protein
MKSMQVKQWSHHFAGDPSEATLREHFKSVEFRVSRKVHEPHLRFYGLMTSATCYLLRGACRYTFDGKGSVLLRAGEFCELPGGDFLFESMGAAETEEVLVWNMRAVFKRAGYPWPFT